MAPPDPILGLTAAFREDPRAHKINLSVGVYQDAEGRTPILPSVIAAEKLIAQRQTSKDYLPIDGGAEYNTRVRGLMFGDKHEVVTSGRALTAHTPGGTAALRVAADFIKQKFPTATVWLSKPTWANHPAIFEAAGLPTKSYAYFEPAGAKLDIDAMLSDLKRIPAGDVVLLHGCCHNPSGIDPTPEEWKRIADVVYDRKLLPLVDFAYQGFGDGLAEDSVGLLELCRPGCELLVANSFSKNFGLYCERVGGLTVVAANADAAKAAMSHVKRAIRTNYSNPPMHGAAIVSTILGDAELRKLWLAELAQMRDRINGMRHTFVDMMKKKTPQRDFSFIATQRGMFSFCGLTPAQVDELRSKHAIYIVGNGRINVAGMTAANLPPLCDAIAAVL